MIDPTILFSLFTLGLVSSAHCIGMCGGIMGALTMAIPADKKAKRWVILFSYNLGRILSYSVMGLLAGLLAGQIAAFGGGVALRVVAGLLLIAMGLYLANWWRGLTRLEAVGRYLWVYLQPLGKGLMPVNSIPKGLLLGALWGWLPCGLVYTALGIAMTQPAPQAAASAMLAFGIGTLPAVLAAGVLANQLKQLLQKPGLRIGLAILIIIFGVWTIWGSLGHAGAHHHASEGSVNHQEMDHSQMNHSDVDHSKMNHSDAEMDHTGADHSHIHHEASAASEPAQQGVISEPNLERQRTDSETKLEDDNNSTSSSVGASHEHHH